MKNASLLTILLELFTAFFSIFFIPFFEFTLPTDISIYLILLIVIIIYAFTDRLNIEARYGLDPSVFSMLKQLSTVFLIILGFIFLKEKIVFKKILGSIIIIVANILLAFELPFEIVNLKHFVVVPLSYLDFALDLYFD